MEFIIQVLDLANKKCNERYSSSLYRLCGMDEKNEIVFKELISRDEFAPLLSRGSLAFLRLIPSLGWTISASLMGATNSLQAEKVMKEIYENPSLYKACCIIKEEFKDHPDAELAAEALLQILGVEKN